MLDTEHFGDALKARGYDFYSGVPCSFLKDLINYAINECEYTMAANEGDAVALCAGARITGRKSVVLMQNSGLTNAVSPLTSLNPIFRLPVLGFVSLRGEPGLADEPQHEILGTATGDLLDAMRIEWSYLPAEAAEAEEALARADAVVEAGKTFFFVVKKGSFGKVALKAKKEQDMSLPTRGSILSAIRDAARPDAAIVATTGFTGRELYELGDDPRNFYMVGSLGCASSFGLGISLAKPGVPVIVLDGDGAILMRTGALATIAHYRPANFLHILMDNGAHESTGGQSTVSDTVDYPALAKACGYPRIAAADDAEEAAAEVARWNKEGGLAFLYVRIRQGAPETLSRPKTKPFEVALRLAAFINSKERV
jgi:phosphonopyruvate decarboxylase